MEIFMDQKLLWRTNPRDWTAPSKMEAGPDFEIDTMIDRTQTTERPDHPLVVDSVSKLCRLATQDDIRSFERIVLKYDHLVRTLRELTTDD